MPSSYNTINLLRTNVGVVDAKTFAQLSANSVNGAGVAMYRSLSPYTKRSYYQQTDHIRQQNFEEKTENLRFGGDVGFNIEKTATCLEKLYLEVDISALTPSGAGTYARLCDYAGLQLLQKIRFTCTQQDFDSYPSLKNFISIMRNTSVGRFALETAPLGGGLSAIQRNARALASQTFRVDLKPYWDEIRSNSPILSAISRLLKVTFSLSDLPSLIQTDYTNGATATITGMRLAYDTVHLPGFERDALSREVLDARGLTSLYEDFHVFGPVKIPAGTTTQVIKLEGFQLPFFTSYGFLQLATDVDTQYNKKPFEMDFSLFNNIKTIQFRESQNLIIDELRGLDDFAKRWQENHSDIPYRTPLIVCRSAYDAKKVCHALSGSLNPQNFSNYSVRIEFNTATTADQYYTHCNVEPNFIVQQGGDIQNVFN